MPTVNGVEFESLEHMEHYADMLELQAMKEDEKARDETMILVSLIRLSVAQERDLKESL